MTSSPSRVEESPGGAVGDNCDHDDDVRSITSAASRQSVASVRAMDKKASWLHCSSRDCLLRRNRNSKLLVCQLNIS